MDIQIQTKLRRNAPCHCGSGRKYKKCCEKKEQKAMEEERKKMTVEEAIDQANAPRLKNEFRDEIRDPYAGIPEDELITRDQAVLLRELRFRVWCGKGDLKHIGDAIEGAKALRVELLGLPKSPYREECLQDVEQYIKQSKQKLVALGPAKSMVLNLMALEEIFGEDVKKLAKPFGPMITPRQGQHPGPESEDEDEDELTIDEEDDPNEVI